MTVAHDLTGYARHRDRLAVPVASGMHPPQRTQPHVHGTPQSATPQPSRPPRPPLVSITPPPARHRPPSPRRPPPPPAPTAPPSRACACPLRPSLRHPNFTLPGHHPSGCGAGYAAAMGRRHKRHPRVPRETQPPPARWDRRPQARPTPPPPAARGGRHARHAPPRAAPFDAAFPHDDGSQTPWPPRPPPLPSSPRGVVGPRRVRRRRPLP